MEKKNAFVIVIDFKSFLLDENNKPVIFLSFAEALENVRINTKV
jgi:hypothetical protein